MSLLFFSGYPGIPFHEHQKLYARVPGRLLSLHASYVEGSRKWLERAYDDLLGYDTRNMEVMFDSGAFTAWTKKQGAIDVKWLLKQYKEFRALCGDHFKDVWFISLDVIPGAPGRVPTPDEIKDAVRRSDENHKKLADEFGDRVIPVFHQGESFERLEEVQAINPSYICVSPQNQIFERHRWEWARNVHQHLKGPIKTHGLATTGGTMMESINWRSVDSASWTMQAAMGSVLIIWDGQLKTLPLSVRNISTRRKQGAHWDTIEQTNERMLKYVDDICAELSDADLTITPAMLRARDTYRYMFNAHVITKWSQRPVQRESAGTLFAL